jgi:hypothetical protein
MTEDSMNKTKRMTKKPLAAAKPRPREKRVYTLEVAILGGPMTKSFARKNRKILRTIEARSDHTLADLHLAIFDAFDRDDEHLYEFQFGGRRPMDPDARRYGPPMAMVDPFGDAEGSADAERMTLDSIGLATGDVFGYWFDFGDDWWHQIEVLAVAEGAPRGKLPKVTQSVGESPPQYVDWDEEA